MDSSQLAEKARELHTQIVRLEGEKYDLEKRFKQLQVEVICQIAIIHAVSKNVVSNFCNNFIEC